MDMKFQLLPKLIPNFAYRLVIDACIYQFKGQPCNIKDTHTKARSVGEANKAQIIQANAMNHRTRLLVKNVLIANGCNTAK